jgi:tRNA pseudouridine55 synthase
MQVHGVFNLNKPSRITSRQAVDRVKHLLKAPKAGHAGTLDPDATGVLLICLGKGTKLFDWLQHGTKEYEGILTLGVTTDTLDASGKILNTSDTSQITPDEVRVVAECFVGEIEQTVPMFSAVRYKGKRLYKLAHRGVELDELPKRKVEIKSLEVLSIRPPHIQFRVVCSKGTYIRVLAADIGKSLGCGAHLSQLTRTRSGHFTLESSHTLDWLEEQPSRAYEAVIPVEAVFEMGNE